MLWEYYGLGQLCLGFLPQCYKLKPCVRVTFLAVLAASLVLVPGDLLTRLVWEFVLGWTLLISSLHPEIFMLLGLAYFCSLSLGVQGNG